MLKSVKRLILYCKKALYLLRCRIQCPSKDFSIISQNCIGGVVYHRLRRRFLSPLINGYMLGEDFCKLCENPRHYFSIDAIVASDEQSLQMGFPVLLIDDVKFFAMHYRSPEEAIRSWNERRLRVNFDRLIVIANQWDLCSNDGFIRRVLRLPYPKLIFVFSPQYKDMENCLYLDEEKYTRRGPCEYPKPLWLDYEPNGYVMHFENDFNFYKLLHHKLK